MPDETAPRGNVSDTDSPARRYGTRDTYSIMLGHVTTTGPGEGRREAWEHRTSGPLTVAAVLFLVAYAWPILDPGMPADRAHALGVFGIVVWLAFVVDYVVRVALAVNRARFVRRHVFDLAVTALPLLRPLRALRVLTVLGFLNRQTGASFRGRAITYVVGAVTMVVGIAALAVLDAERRGDNSNITTIGDALWWAMTSITTVGYGDRYPTTGEGRLVGVGLMLAGIALLGVITAAFASWFLDKVATLTAAEQRTEVTLEEVVAEVRALRAEVARLSTPD
jgi:voltage-gated potassium channel